jgi:hypothetical protein
MIYYTIHKNIQIMMTQNKIVKIRTQSQDKRRLNII